MIRLVVDVLQSGTCSPDKLLEKIATILDDVSEQFVKKLWQVLIFEQLKIEAGVYGDGDSAKDRGDSKRDER